MEHKRIKTEQLKGAAIQQTVKRGVAALLYSSVFISCCAFCLTIETYLLADQEVSLAMATFVFLSTLFTYNLSSVQSVLRGNHRRKSKGLSLSWAQQHKPQLAILGILSLLGAVALYLTNQLQVNIWIVLHVAIIAIGYTVPIIYKRQRVRPLRSIPLLKVFLIAYVWSAVTVLFPLIEAGYEVWEAATLLLWVRRLLFILALALLFDIRDYNYDKKTNTLTFPGLIGVKNTKLLALILLVCYTVLAVSTEEGATQAALIASAVVAAGVVWYASESRPRIYYALLADGAMLVHFAFIYLANF